MKIVFIAMSGVRVQDQELLAEGLTLPGFVERSEVIASLPSLGLLTLAGATPDTYEKVYIDLENVRDKSKLPMDVSLVVISSFTAQIFEAYELADYYRNHQTKVIMGGLHVTVLPEEALEHCDAVCIGEGEAVWPLVMADFAAGGLQQRYIADGKYAFDQHIIPAYELLNPEKYNRLTIQTSRGCPHSCEFCAGSILLTSKYKQKSIADVLTEIDKIQQIWPRPFIELADDNSFVNKAYWRELLPELSKRKIRWFTEADIDVGNDQDFLNLLYESGCKEVLIGLESPVKEGLDQLELRNNWKLKKQQKYKENIFKIQQAGIRVNACFIIGLDAHDKSIFEAVYDFAKETCVYDVQVTLPTPFPGTGLYKRLKRENRLLEDNAWDKCTLFDILFEPVNFSVEELRDGFRALVKRLYSEEFTNYRRQGFGEMLKNTWRHSSTF